MSDPSSGPQDELAGTEQPFVQHLIELRDRMVYALAGVGVCMVLLAFWPGPSGLAVKAVKLPSNGSYYVCAAFKLRLPVAFCRFSVSPGWRWVGAVRSCRMAAMPVANQSLQSFHR